MKSIFIAFLKSTLSKVVFLGFMLFSVFPLNAQHLQWLFQPQSTGYIGFSDEIIDKHGNILVTGIYTGIVDFNPDSVGVKFLSSTNSNSYFIAKYSPGGALIWAKKCARSSSNILLDTKLKLDKLGNIYLFGMFNGIIYFDTINGSNNYLNGYFDLFAAKYDSTAQIIWANSLTTDSVNDYIGDLEIDGLGNVYMTGGFHGRIKYFNGSTYTYTSSTGNGTTFDIFLVKYDINGNRIWIKSIGSTNDDYGRRLLIDSLGNIIISGAFAGTVDFDPGPALHNITLIGNPQAQTFFAKFNSLGGFLWANAFRAPIEFIKINKAGELVILGRITFNNIDFDPGPGVTIIPFYIYQYNPIYMAKYTLNGAFKSIKYLPEYSDDAKIVISAACFDSSENILIVGSYKDSIDFDPGAGVNLKCTSDTTFNPFLAMYDTSFALISVNEFYGRTMRYNWSEHLVFKNIQSDLNNNIYIVGSYIDTIDFDLGPQSYIKVSNDTLFYNPVFVKYDGNLITSNKTNAIEVSDLKMKIYPNPSQGKLYLQGNSEKKRMEAEIIDLLGRKQYSFVFYESTYTIDLMNLENGLYYLKLNSSGTTKTIPFQIIHE
ncbi:MAG: T9SS type A sorting domain-containing protein [Bacteroidetes bacterium]|nr:T9SS type A sorting domain-containing protein [Bacteroidota bacterium]